MPARGGERAPRVLASLVAAVILAAGAQAAAAPERAGEVGQAVPDFTLSGIDGAPVTFERHIRGKAPLTMFFFMTTACSACYEELQEIDAYLGRNPGKLEVWCVAVDLRGIQTVAPFQRANRFRVKYLIDPKFSLPRIFGFNYTPSLAIVNSNGVVLHKKGGYSPNERISDLIRTFSR